MTVPTPDFGINEKIGYICCTMVRRVQGKSLINEVFSYDVILVGMGIHNSFSGGFEYDVGLNFPAIKEAANECFNYGDRRLLGTVLPIEVSGLTFCLCYIHKGGFRKGEDGSYVDYTALRKCLEWVSERYGGKKIASPCLGCSKSDGAGNEETAVGIFNDVFKEGDSVDVYDSVNDIFDDAMYRKIVELNVRRMRGEISYDEFTAETNKVYWKRENGIFKPMPDGYRHKNKRFSWDDVIWVTANDLKK